ncbi:isocitrate lyase/PEP mutase family protein [Sphingomonas hankyongi]|uniref:isocitrate lyase/PEP mutase family protein n=1 Tax=Sphingomonas hankyongi TaxID=2908209 RepID=UPI0024C168E8|nr:isocitrate lyase/phosphoenolpyruvate mutase family protein [Sphingomonas hankyongi]
MSKGPEPVSIQERAAQFRALHRAGSPLALFNAWDAGSARAVVKGGAKAVGTGSWSIAAAHGFEDGEKIPRETNIEIVHSIVESVDVPVTADLESGYSAEAVGVGETVRLNIEAGAIGCNLEDSQPADGGLRSIEDAAERYRAARRAADGACPGYFINARTDVFAQRPADEHDSSMVEEALRRAKAFAEAGADGLFVPFVTDLELIRQLARQSPLPLNVMRVSTTPSIADLSAAGVARISHGPYPYLIAMSALESAAREIA